MTLTLGIIGLLRIPHVGLGALRPHPIWLVVLVVAARYGARGVIVAAPIGWVALALVGSPGAHMLGNLLSALSAPVELGALTAAVLVGWVASAHERTAAGFVEQLRQLGRARENRRRGARASCGRRRWPCAPATIASSCR